MNMYTLKRLDSFKGHEGEECFFGLLLRDATKVADFSESDSGGQVNWTWVDSEFNDSRSKEATMFAVYAKTVDLDWTADRYLGQLIEEECARIKIVAGEIMAAWFPEDHGTTPERPSEPVTEVACAWCHQAIPVDVDVWGPNADEVFEGVLEVFCSDACQANATAHAAT